MQQVADLLAHHLEQHHRAGDLQAAAGGACAGAHDHHQQQNCLGELGPEVEVRRGVAGGGDDRGHLKGRQPQRLAEIIVQRHDVGGDQRDAHAHDAQIVPALAALGGRAEAADQQQVVEVEVDAEEQHEHRDDPLQIRAVACDAVGLHAEAAGARGAEGVHDALEQRHAADPQKDDLQKGHAHVDLVQNACSVPCAGHQLAHYGAGHLRAHDVDGAVGDAGHQCHHEHQHAHAAHPVGKAAPEQQAPAHDLHICQDRRAGGGEAADGLEEGVDVGGDLPGDVEGQRTQRGDRHPGQRHGDEALSGVDHLGFRPAQQRQRKARRQRNRRRNQDRPQAAFAVDERR